MARVNEKDRKNKLAKKINRMVINLHNFMAKLSTVKFILVAVFIIILIVVVFSPLFKKYPIIEGYLEPKVTSDKLFGLVVVAPIWETFIFQALPLFILDARIPGEEKIRLSSILISAFLFGIVHYFDYNNSFIKFLCTFFDGIVLAYAYELYKVRDKKPFLVTAIIHSFSNFIMVIPTLLIQM